MSERPDDLIYALDERPPPLELLALGFQHASAICPYLVMVALVAGAAKLSPEAARNALALAMVAVALLTVLQSLRLGWLGSGYLCPPVVSAIYLPSSMAVAAKFGFATMCGMVMFSGACETVIAGFVSRLRKLFPAIVSGVVIIAVGIELGKIGLGVLLKDGGGHDIGTGRNFVTAFCVLATMTSLAVWAKGLPRLLCVLIGIVVGYAVAALLGVFPKDFVMQLSQSPLFALPDPSFLSYDFAPSFMVPFAVAGLASGLRVVGVLTTCQQMNDAAWHRPDMKNIQGGVMADGSLSVAAVRADRPNGSRVHCSISIAISAKPTGYPLKSAQRLAVSRQSAEHSTVAISSMHRLRPYICIPDPPDLTKSRQSAGEIIDLARQLQASGLLKADWDPAKHPRWPAGSPDSIGGRFAPAGTASNEATADESRPSATPAQLTIPVPFELCQAFHSPLKSCLPR